MRGITFDVCVIDEGAFVNPELFFTVVLPVWEVGETALICISTPTNSLNAYMSMFSILHPVTGLPLIPTVRVKLICDRCEEVGRKWCPHNKKYYPDWKRSGKHEVLKIIMDSTNISRELLGTDPEFGERVVPDVYINTFESARRYEAKESEYAKAILVTCDPNNGGGNEFAIVSTVSLSGYMVIVGLESHATKSAKEQADLVKAHVTALSKVPWLKYAKIMFVSERNSGTTAGFLCNPIFNIRNVLCLKEHKDKDFGWWTTKEEKMEGARAMESKFSEGAIVFMQRFVCVNPFIEDANQRVTRTYNEFMEQLRKYKYINLPNQSIRNVRNAVRSVSGKCANADGKVQQGSNDDMVVMLGMNLVIWKRIFTFRVPELPYNEIVLDRHSMVEGLEIASHFDHIHKGPNPQYQKWFPS